MLWRFRFTADARGGEPAARNWIDGYGKAALFRTRAAFCGPIPACTLEVVHLSYWREAARCELSQMN